MLAIGLCLGLAGYLAIGLEIGKIIYNFEKKHDFGVLALGFSALLWPIVVLLSGVILILILMNVFFGKVGEVLVRLLKLS